MSEEFNKELCDERHERVAELHEKQDQQTVILIRLDGWSKAHMKAHDKSGKRASSLITWILSLAAVVVAVFALTK